MRLNNVLVPMDFSPPSRLAFNCGVAFARKFQARLTLLHVVELADGLTLAEHYEQAHRMLAALIAPADRNHFDLRVVVKPGGIEDQILSTVRENDDDLIVMGTHGRGLIGRWLVGSVTQTILRNAEIPILTVCHVTRRPAFERILFATDLSDPSIENADAALEIAQVTNANLVAMHSVEVGVDGGAEAAVYLAPERRAEARSRMEGFKEEAIRRNVKIELEFGEGVAAKAILKTAEQKAADLIMITIRKDESIHQNVLGTTAEHVIREAHVPVLTIPVGAKAEPTEAAETRAA